MVLSASSTSASDGGCNNSGCEPTNQLHGFELDVVHDGDVVLGVRTAAAAAALLRVVPPSPQHRHKNGATLLSSRQADMQSEQQSTKQSELRSNEQRDLQSNGQGEPQRNKQNYCHIAIVG